MSRLEFRKVDNSLFHSKRVIESWINQGVEVTWEKLPPGAPLLSFTADDTWTGIIDLREWCCNTFLDLTGMALDKQSLADIENLFLTTPRPFEPPLSDLEYGFIKSEETSSELPLEDIGKLICVTTPQARIWLPKLPIHCFTVNSPIIKTIDLSTLPINLVLELGQSKISLRLLKKIDVGGVFLVRTLTKKILSAGKIVGSYYNVEEGIMLDLEETFIDHEIGYDVDLGEDDNSEIASRDKIPVNLSFILQRKVVSVSDLESLYKGQVMPVEHDIEKRIEIRANGVLLARGEIVNIDDRLGVEINELYNEGLHVK